MAAVLVALACTVGPVLALVAPMAVYAALNPPQDGE
jgi:hypothetical protein